MKIAVVGCSGFGERHLKALNETDFEIYIYERKPKIAEELIKKYKILENFETYDALLSSDVEAVDLVLPHDLHEEFTVKALRSGKNVIVEKPISTDLKSAMKMVSEAEKQNRYLMVAEQYHFDPTVRAIKKAMDSGIIGKPLHAIIRDQRSVKQKGWRLSASSMGGGSLIDGGVHYLDVAVSLFGELSVVSSTATRGNSGIEGNDTYSAILKNNSDLTCTFFYSWSYMDPPIVPSIEVMGDRGSIYEKPESRSIKQSEGKWTPFGDIVIDGKDVPVQYEDIFINEFREFEHSIYSGEKPYFLSSYAMEDLRLALEIEKKAAE